MSTKNFALAASIIGILLVGAGCAGTAPAPATPSVQAPTPVTAQPAAPAADQPSAAPPTAGGLDVAIQNFSFQPPILTVKAGSTVTWTNDDSASHGITPVAGAAAVGLSDAAATSKLLNQGDSWSLTFPSAGTFEYRCSVHPSMTGKVIVTP